MLHLAVQRKVSLPGSGERDIWAWRKEIFIKRKKMEGVRDRRLQGTWRFYWWKWKVRIKIFNLQIYFQFAMKALLTMPNSRGLPTVNYTLTHNPTADCIEVLQRVQPRIPRIGSKVWASACGSPSSSPLSMKLRWEGGRRLPASMEPASADRPHSPQELISLLTTS